MILVNRNKLKETFKPFALNNGGIHRNVRWRSIAYSFNMFNGSCHSFVLYYEGKWNLHHVAFDTWVVCSQAVELYLASITGNHDTYHNPREISEW